MTTTFEDRCINLLSFMAQSKMFYRHLYVKKQKIKTIENVYG